MPEPSNEERRLSLLRRGFSAMPVDSIEPGQDGHRESFEGFDGYEVQVDERFLIQYREHRKVSSSIFSPNQPLISSSVHRN